ncbi:hypothetical protein L9F63_009426, partial [Diploptera punctata]
ARIPPNALKCCGLTENQTRSLTNSSELTLKSCFSRQMTVIMRDFQIVFSGSLVSNFVKISGHTVHG